MGAPAIYHGPPRRRFSTQPISLKVNLTFEMTYLVFARMVLFIFGMVYLVFEMVYWDR